MTAASIPTLKTERLHLRAPKLSDLDSYAAFGASERSAGVGGPFSHGDAFTRLTALLGHWHLRGYGRWMVADPETDAALGIVGLYYPSDWPEPEISWTVFDAAEGRGIAFEAAQAARSYAYDVLEWDTAISCIMPSNTRSRALAQRMGCHQEPSFLHPVYGELEVWRHLGPDDISDGGMEAYA